MWQVIGELLGPVGIVIIIVFGYRPGVYPEYAEGPV